MVELVIFILMGGAAVLGALTVIRARNPVYSALGLLATLFAVAVLYVVQLAHFVAAVQVIVYAGAVMTLFLFVIMLIGVDQLEDTTERLPYQRWLALGLGGAGIVLGIVLAVSGRFSWVPAAASPFDPEAANGTIQAVAEPLFTGWVLAFEATALLLTIGAAGAVALAFFRRREPGETP
jgi:NADH-quinone oxidoreductase subunit J